MELAGTLRNQRRPSGVEGACAGDVQKRLMNMADRKFVVTAQWDDEARVWVATSEDIPGLVTEAATLDELRDRVLAVASELIEENAHLISMNDADSDLIQFCVESVFSRNVAHAH